MVLRDMGNPPPPVLGPPEDIPAGFWKIADIAGSRGFEAGYASAESEEYPAYDAISLREKEVNAFVSLHRDLRRGVPAESEAPAARLRDKSWEEWVAALATLAHEHQISGTMKQHELLGLIEARLRTWEVKIKPNSTVRTTASKVLERFKIDPPTKPLVVTKPEKP
jgi:hypothetical protein